MGLFRFRQSIRLAPGVRINLGKRGASLSVGRPGATVNIGKKGLRTTVGAPGTGLSYTFGGKAKDAPRDKSTPSDLSPSVRPMSTPKWVFFNILVWPAMFMGLLLLVVEQTRGFGLFLLTVLGLIYFVQYKRRKKALGEVRDLAAQRFDVPRASQADIEIEYVDGDGASIRRRVTPHEIVTWGGDGYGINGHCHLRDEHRTFLVSRISSLVDLGSGQVFDDPGDYLVSLGIPRDQVPSYRRPGWIAATMTLLSRVSAVHPLPSDADRVRPVLWGLQKKIGVVGPQWHLPDLAEVSEVEVNEALRALSAEDADTRKKIADTLGSFAQGEDDLPADHPRRVVARQFRSFLSPRKRKGELP